MKIFLAILGFTAAVLIGLSVILLLSIGPIAGWFVNQKAGDFIAAPLRVDAVSANLPAGRLGFRGFELG